MRHLICILLLMGSFRVVAQTPTITDFSPASGIVGSQVVINGTNFDPVSSNNVVKFNNSNAASVVSGTTTTLTVIVPSNATTGPITVRVNIPIATSVTNFIVGPIITNFNPNLAAEGQSVTISGDNFDLNPSGNAVSFNGTPGIVTASTSTSVTATVPVGATTGTISVTANGMTGTSSASITIAPTVKSFNPPSGTAGTVVTITGTNYDLVPANNTVRFNGVLATVTSSTLTTITATVPSGLTTGPISVKVSNQTGTSSTSFGLAPSVNGFEPQSGPPGTSVQITGTSFNSIPAGNTVRFNGIAATVTAATATSLTVTVPASATTGTLSVTVGSLTGTSIAAFTVTPPDNTPPLISVNNTASTVAKGSGLSVSVIAVDNESGIASATLYWRPVAGTGPNDFQTRPMSLSAGSYVASLQTSDISPLGVEYKVLVVNGVGLDNSANSAVTQVPVLYPNGMAIPYEQAGRNSENYRMIAIPLQLSTASANEVFESALGSYDPAHWRMFHYSNGSYSELNGTSPLQPGIGYWFITDNAASLTTPSGTTVAAGVGTPYTITLRPGWNQIGNPYPFNISFADLLTANPTQAANLGGADAQFRVYRGTVSNGDVLHASEGAFIKYLGSSTTTIDVPVAINNAIQGRSAAPVRVSQSPDDSAWLVGLSLRNGNLVNTVGGVGMAANAKVEADVQDDFVSPRFIDYLDMKFPIQFAGMTVTRSVVPKADQWRWDFAVETNASERLTTLTWSPVTLAAGREMKLIDLTTYRVTDMTQTGTYTFDQTVSQNFRIALGSQEYVKAGALPSRLVLEEPSPQPATDKARISYVLPEGATAALTLHDLMGVPLMTHAVSGAGGGVLELDLTALPSGFYLVRLSGAGEAVTKKLIKR